MSLSSKVNDGVSLTIGARAHGGAAIRANQFDEMCMPVERLAGRTGFAQQRALGQASVDADRLANDTRSSRTL
jgi:hypothetical protein